MSDYEDDFENYDDDGFEPEDEDAYEVLPKSMLQRQPSAELATNKPSSTVRPPSTTPQHHLQSQYRPPSAQRPLAIPSTPLLSDGEMRARHQRLTLAKQKIKRISLQEVPMDDLFQLASLSQYDLYCMARGIYSKLKVAAVQTNDDAKEEECQTSEVPSRAYSCQVPDDRDQMSEAEVFAFSMSIGLSSRKGTSSSASKSQSMGAVGSAAARVMHMEPGVELKLAHFMNWAGPTMLAALGMTQDSLTLEFSPEQGGVGKLCTGVITLHGEHLLAQRPVTALAFCSGGTTPLLLAAYGPVGAQLGAEALLKDHTLSSKGCLCLWDLSISAQPRAVMFSEGSPACAALGPFPASHLVFAGMEEGGVCVWDLDEPGSRHPQEIVGGIALPGRRPSYTTEGNSSHSSSSLGPITGIEAVPKEGGGRTTPCMVVAVTAWGDVQVYTASLLGGAGGSSAADVDLGMRIGSRVRLLRNVGLVRLGMDSLSAWTIRGGASGVEGGGSWQGKAGYLGSEDVGDVEDRRTVCAHCLVLLHGPKERGQLLVGSDAGRALRGSWMGTPPAPKVFIAEDLHSQAAVSSEAAGRLLATSTRCLAVSQFSPKVFLAGHSNGSISLHSTHSGPAVILWPEVGQGEVLAIAWHPDRPACFMALDAACMVHSFDLTKDRGAPVLRQSFMMQNAQSGLASIPTTLRATQLQPAGKGTPVLPVLAVGLDDGGVEIHLLSNTLTQGGGDEESEVAFLEQMCGLQNRESGRQPVA